MITVTIQTTNTGNVKMDNTKLIQVLKPHSMPITVMSLNTSCRCVLYEHNGCTLIVTYDLFLAY